ncbi:MAG: hypothetical protein IPL52_09500 [Flavobacteriales bacterium]|nr:hypothetical protein [Flavobacteriales bacterium]
MIRQSEDQTIGIQDLLASVPPTKRLAFCERLAFDLTIVNRDIWSNDSLSDVEKLNALKESNELLHRLWGIIWKIRRGEGEAFSQLQDNCLFYIQQAPELGRPLHGMLKLTLKHILEAN